MNNKFCLLTSLFVVSVFFVQPVFSDDTIVTDPDVPEIKTENPSHPRETEVGLQVWVSMGHGEWEIDFGGLFFDGRSKLEWDDIDAPVIILHAETPITEKLSIGGLFGYGDISDGQNTDGDWINDFQFSESQSDASGDVKLYDINLYYNVVVDEIDGKPFIMDVFIGYQYYKDDLTDKNGVQTVDNQRQVYRPFFGLDSKYSFEWEMLRLGVRGEIEMDEKVTLGGSLAYLYLLDYNGEAFWNLREDYRRTDPNFVHDSSSGDGVEAKATIRVRLSESVYVDGGYWIISMSADDGTDTIYFADGTTGTSDLTNVETTRHGAYAGVIFEF